MIFPKHAGDLWLKSLSLQEIRYFPPYFPRFLQAAISCIPLDDNDKEKLGNSLANPWLLRFSRQNSLDPMGTGLNKLVFCSGSCLDSGGGTGFFTDTVVIVLNSLELLLTVICDCGLALNDVDDCNFIRWCLGCGAVSSVSLGFLLSGWKSLIMTCTFSSGKKSLALFSRLITAVSDTLISSISSDCTFCGF